jgi:uncharacterized iron-regulated membrane protein
MPIRIIALARRSARAVLGGVAVGAAALALATAAAALPASAVDGVYAGVLVGTATALVAGALALGAFERSARRTRLVALHRLLGLLAAAPLCVFAVTGVLLLFRAEVEGLLDPARRVAPRAEVAAPSAWLAGAGATVALDEARALTLTWPDRAGRPASVRTQTPGGTHEAFVDPASGRLLDTRPLAWLDTVRALHVRLLLGPPGYVLSGAAALAGAWLAWTGWRIGRRLWRHALRIRTREGVRPLWLDVHQRLGTWALPGLALFCVTGVALALFGVLAEGPIRLRFGGDHAAFWAARGPVDPPGPAAPPLAGGTDAAAPADAAGRIDDLVSAARSGWPAARLHSVRIERPGAPDATATVRLVLPDAWPTPATALVRLALADGRPLGVRRAASVGSFERTEQTIAALHTAERAPTIVRGLYAAFGLGVALLPATGLVLFAVGRSR